MTAKEGHFAHNHKKYFDEIDKDKSGFIDRKEVVELLKRVNIPPSKKLIDDIFKECDTDGDGKISDMEFEKYAAAQDKKLYAMFSDMDQEKRGFITPEDFMKMIHRIDPNVPDSTIQLLLDNLDNNNDKEIHYDEFIRYYHLVPISSIKSTFDFFQFESIDTGENLRAASERPKGTSAYITLASGAVAGAISRTATAPIDRVKVFMMVSHKSRSISSMFKELIRDDGFRGLFRGNGTNVIKIMPETAIKMLTYDRIKELTCKNPKNPTMRDRFVSGGIAGLVASTLIYPMDLAKTKLALSHGRGHGKHYKGLFDCLYKIGKNEGFSGLFRGWSAGAVGGVPYAAVDLGVFNTLKDTYINYAGTPPSALIMLWCGAISGICGQTITYPLLVVRTRLQNQRPGHIEYTGMMNCLTKTFKQEGFRGLFRGILPNYMKGVPAISISYAVFEKTKEFFSTFVSAK